VTARLRRDVLTKLYELPQRWHDRGRSGAVHSLAVQDTERVEWALSDTASLILPAVLLSIALGIAALVIDPLLFAVTLAATGPLMIVVLLLNRRAHRRARDLRASSQQFSATVQVLLRALGMTKSVGAEEWEVRRAAGQGRDLAERYAAFERSRAASYAVDSSVAAAAGSLVLVVGTITVADGSTTLGGLLSFYAVLALMLRHLHAAAAHSNTVMMGLQSLPRVEELLGVEEEEPYAGGGRALELRGEVELDGVEFAFDAAPVLRDITLTIGASERVALIGPNGAGKSTLVSLLLGLYRPQRGELRADGVPYDELDMRALRRRIGVVLQDPVLLPGTIRDNIAYARPDASDDQVRMAAEAATADRFVEALPDGYATLVGDEGVGLSGGQRQRIAIARALLGAPALLILDEPTAYLDERAVTELMARLQELPQAPTLLLVTHDPEVAKHAERVIELRDGRIVRNSGESRREGLRRAAS
jgi:ABC-type multidrug transport system fused ATPase/permease subunit